MTHTRRRFLGAATGAFAGAIAAPSILRAAGGAERLVITNMLPLSGFMAMPRGEAMEGPSLGIRLAGDLPGISPSVELLDDEADPGKAVRRVKDAMERDGRRYFVGPILSSVAAAVSKEIYRNQGVLVTGSGADELTGVDCNRSTFRWSVPTYGVAKATVGVLMDMYPDARRWYAIAPKYSFGENLVQHMNDLAVAKKREVVGTSFHSVRDQDFSGIITAASNAKPDVLVIFNVAGQALSTIREAIGFGMKERAKILVPWSFGLQEYRALGPDLTEGLFFGVQYWHKIDTPTNARLVKIAREEFNRTPDFGIATTSSLSRIILEGARKAGSPRAQDVIAALEGLSYEGLTGRETIRPGDHQVLRPYYLLRGKAKAAMTNADDFCDILAATSEFVDPSASQCKMI
ncbi:ABC transporter substrate-binding protein [Bradyrhizobium sp.]|uniref:ABC transporter substrate-binding protein n=1 Tax=Bradyrhizobium sp. TaxID=376 RepID=UPI0039E2A500